MIIQEISQEYKWGFLMLLEFLWLTEFNLKVIELQITGDSFFVEAESTQPGGSLIASILHHAFLCSFSEGHGRKTSKIRLFDLSNRATVCVGCSCLLQKMMKTLMI